MISDDPAVCLFDGADGTPCNYRPICGQRTGEVPCVGMEASEYMWSTLPPDVQAKYSSGRVHDGH